MIKLGSEPMQTLKWKKYMKLDNYTKLSILCNKVHNNIKRNNLNIKNEEWVKNIWYSRIQDSVFKGWEKNANSLHKGLQQLLSSPSACPLATLLCLSKVRVPSCLLNVDWWWRAWPREWGGSEVVWCLKKP